MVAVQMGKQHQIDFGYIFPVAIRFWVCREKRVDQNTYVVAFYLKIGMAVPGNFCHNITKGIRLVKAARGGRKRRYCSLVQPISGQGAGVNP